MASLGWVSNPAETRGPLILAVFWTLFTLSTITLGLRLWFRWKHTRWQPDDYVLTFSWICFLGYTMVNHLAVSLGLGHHALDIRYKNIETIAILGSSGITITMIGITAAKISFAVTLLQLTRNLWKWTNWLIWFIIISLVIVVIPTAIFPWVQCRPFAKTYLVFLPGECFDRSYAINYGIFQGIYAATTDFVLALLPWKVLWSLQMRPVDKFGLGMAMSLGLIAGVMAIMRVSAIPYLLAQDLSYDGVFAVIWAAVELAATIIAACIPVLRKMVHEEVSTRNQTGPSTSGSRSAQQPSSDQRFRIRVKADTWGHELSLISMTTPTPEVARLSDESAILRITQTSPTCYEQGQLTQKKVTGSETDTDDRRNSEILPPWPEVAHMRGRSFRGIHASSPI